MKIRFYEPNDEVGWVRCRVLSFLDTAYYDSVYTKKECYSYPSIELVAVDEGKVVGLLDIEYEQNAKTICTLGEGIGGMIWHLAVHPDYQRMGIAKKLLAVAEQYVIEKNVDYLEAWTRDDEWVNRWYQKQGFAKISDYLHVYVKGKVECKQVIGAQQKMGFQLQQAFAHYTGKDQQMIKSSFERVHVCNGYYKKMGK